MADKKISALTAASTPLAGTEVLPIVQSGSTVKVAVSNLTAGRSVSMSGGVISNGGTLRSYRPGNAIYTDQYMAAGGNGGYIFDNANSDGFKWQFAGVDQFAIDTSGNWVPKVAAKGVNFTANTPAAGMTSQLLNWYEEGTFTPTITAGSGTITSYTSSGFYTRVGKTITVFITFTVTNGGTASGNANISGLPFTSKNMGDYVAVVNAREGNVTGSIFTVLIDNNATTALVLGANWGTNAKYVFSATYLLA